MVFTLGELSFRDNDYVCLLGKLEPDKRPLAVLEDHKSATIKSCFEELKRTGVKGKVVVMGMKDSWRKVVQGVFPQVQIIVNPFHVVQDANRRWNEVRKVEQEVKGETYPDSLSRRPRRNSPKDKKSNSRRFKRSTPLL